MCEWCVLGVQGLFHGCYNYLVKEEGPQYDFDMYYDNNGEACIHRLKLAKYGRNCCSF